MGNVTESDLYSFFRRIGDNSIASIRVCRDSQTQESLRYAYVNFHNEDDARRALDALNYEEIDGRPCRISWTRRDPAVRKSGVGNLFVKNLDKRMDHVGLHEVFENFGEILSCKVSVDWNTGESRGYGFVHFANPEDAKKATESLNGKYINVGEESAGDKGKKIYVGPFVPRNQRANSGVNFTNIYLKQMNPSLTSEEFAELVTKATSDIAKVTSPWLSTRSKEDGSGEESRGFGFVNFETHEGAVRALSRFQDLNKLRELAPGLLHPKDELYAAQAVPKNKRKRQISQAPNRNLYIKNIASSVTDQQLHDLFASFGEITSAKIMVNEDTGERRGFGFVCFKKSEDARAAITKMNNQMFEGKPLYVALAQPKDQRRKQLEAQFNNNSRMMGMYPGYGAQRMMRPPMPAPRPGYSHPMPVQRAPYMVHMNPNPNGEEGGIRELLKRIPDEAKFQAIGDNLFGSILQSEKDDNSARRIVGILLLQQAGAPVEERIQRLITLCEDPEKRAEEIDQIKKRSNQN